MTHAKVKGKNSLIFAFHVGKSGFLRLFTWTKSKNQGYFGFHMQIALFQIALFQIALFDVINSLERLQIC